MTHPDHLASDDAANLARLLDASPTLAATAAHVRSFETSDARWFTAGDIPALPIRPAMAPADRPRAHPRPPLPHRLTSPSSGPPG
jgi:hypothetical protein